MARGGYEVGGGPDGGSDARGSGSRLGYVGPRTLVRAPSRLAQAAGLPSELLSEDEDLNATAAASQGQPWTPRYRRGGLRAEPLLLDSEDEDFPMPRRQDYRDSPRTQPAASAAASSRELEERDYEDRRPAPRRHRRPEYDEFNERPQETSRRAHQTSANANQVGAASLSISI